MEDLRTPRLNMGDQKSPKVPLDLGRYVIQDGTVSYSIETHNDHYVLYMYVRGPHPLSLSLHYNSLYFSSPQYLC